MMHGRFVRLPKLAAILAVALAVAACVIRLRGEEARPQPATPVAQPSDQSADVGRCRTVSYEDKDALGECRKMWALKRRQFLGRQSGSSPFADDQPARSGLPASTALRDEDRQPPAYPTPERE
jgi:conjugative transfer region protein TrbK